MLSWNMRFRSAVGYGAAMAVSVGFFLLVAPNLAGSLASWIAGIASSLAALAVGWWMGRWYVPVLEERPTFELFLCPPLVLVLSLLLGLATLAAWALAFGPAEARPAMGFGVVLFFGVVVFFSVAWPAVVVAFGVVGIWLARCSRSAPNNSFKPKPLRGSA
ncbi:hypothetical protein MNR01_06440 [Lysobacter sp. S4-A87]|uniref:hypothetical protein n=1 Tax=Lysobacter sp. S4-A87 TaxID=2925843 RepID=UPI001F52F0CC|nr:hypothetical protein [Lysobacter sp. S4-A87]UNK50639.1 hypothetical protein MNR01_06440 [Lysobacter sp. S4-A87]